MRLKNFAFLLVIAFTLLSACSLGTDRSKDTSENNGTAQNTDDNQSTSDNQSENNATGDDDSDSDNEADDDEFSDLLSDDHMPNVPDGPNVPDFPEYKPPNIPDFPDVDLPNVNIEGDEDEITMQVPDALLFDFDESELKSEALETLDEVGLALVEYDGAKVQINGHTDNVGDADYNMKLSEKRAKAVEKYLKEQGALDDVNVQTKGYGKTEPIASNDNEEGQQKNRRVEIVIEPAED